MLSPKLPLSDALVVRRLRGPRSAAGRRLLGRHFPRLSFGSEAADAAARQRRDPN
jgi:hypothetical protein